MLRSQTPDSEAIRQTQESEDVSITADRSRDSSLLIPDWFECGKYFGNYFHNVRSAIFINLPDGE